MKPLAFLLAAGIVAANGASAVRPRGPFPLLSLNSFGDVSWLCAPGSSRERDRFGLRYSQATGTATTRVRLVVGGRTVKTVQTNPGSAVRFPLLRPARQKLILVARTEPGTLTARVSVDFVRPYRRPSYAACWKYMPPPATASISFSPN
jgi:hypothetical protein